ncbi:MULTISPECIES: hypothetical protein [unclassified Caulobacter]|uniref:CC0125/CC1285 family lipoprotein n=1 Tax=unclassified Caulobacter TaxID=2648921 RepID=UPI000554DE1A|nr:hypothetical protein [Caulobacter sp. UNC358MFTsu5.1]
MINRKTIAGRARMVAAVALAALLTACATATPYQPNIAGQKAQGGFSDRRLESDRYQVNFAGNSMTSRETVERYLLYRAAEVTVQAGYDWFETADRRTDRQARAVIDNYGYGPGWGGYGYGWGGPYGYWRPAWRGYYGGYWGPWGDPFWGGSTEVRTIEKFQASAEILLHKGPKPAGDPRAYDAREIMTNLGPTIQRPVASAG